LYSTILQKANNKNWGARAQELHKNEEQCKSINQDIGGPFNKHTSYRQASGNYEFLMKTALQFKIFLLLLMRYLHYS